MIRPGGLSPRVSVSSQEVSLEVAEGDGVTELVVVASRGGPSPGGAVDAEVEVLGIPGPPAIRHPEGPLVVGCVLLGNDNRSAVLGG